MTQAFAFDSLQILDNLPDGITIQDRTFTIVYQNVAMQSAFGNQIGMKCYVAYERRDAICEDCGVARLFKIGQPIHVLRTAFDTHGETSYWENACFPICDDEGDIIAGAEVCRNITNRVNLEDEVKQRNIELGQLNKQLQMQTLQLSETLQQLNHEVKQLELTEAELFRARKLEAVGQLAAGIAHEINTPMQYVSDSVHFVEESLPDILDVLQAHEKLLDAVKDNTATSGLIEEMEKQLVTIDLNDLLGEIPTSVKQALKGVERVTAIVRAMKEFSRTGGKEMAEADLNKAIEATVMVARNEWRYVAEIELKLDPALPQVTCFIGELKQSVLNLVVNAAHAISRVVNQNPGAKGKITVCSSRDGDNVEVRVSDTGTGIPESERPRIFDPFFTTKEVGKGMGQGLFVVYNCIVKMHSGTVHFETTVGEGTTFIVRFPIVPHAPVPDNR